MAHSMSAEDTAGQGGDTTFARCEIKTCHKWREVNIKWHKKFIRSNKARVKRGEDEVTLTCAIAGRSCEFLRCCSPFVEGCLSM